MKDDTQPEALRIADEFIECLERDAIPSIIDVEKAVAELCRQHARIAELEAQLESIGAGGVSGPLMGQPQAMPDLTALTERGAKAWTGVDAQALREGGASPLANAGEPSGHIKEPYTLAEIKAKIASNDYSAEMLLQHAMLLLDSASLSASVGSELVYQARYQKGFWQDSSRERYKYLQNPENTCAEDWETRILYLHPSPPDGIVGGWIALPGALPEPGVPVLLDIGKKYPIRALWAAKHTVEAADDDTDWAEYDEATETYYCPEGWYEWNEHEEIHWAVTETPRSWAPLPPTASAGSGKGE